MIEFYKDHNPLDTQKIASDFWKIVGSLGAIMKTKKI
jgi:hypothetical protein